MEEESTPKFQVPIANFESLKSIEPRKVNFGLENLDSVGMNENQEHGLTQSCS